MTSNITYWHPFPENMTSIASFMTWANTSANDSLGLIIVIAVWVIIFASLKIYGNNKGMATATFITMIISILLARVDMVGWYIPSILLIGLVVTTILVRNDAEKYGI